MQPQGRDQDRSSIPVVAGTVDVLQVERSKDSTPNVRRVVKLDYVFASIVSVAVPHQVLMTETGAGVLDSDDDLEPIYLEARL
jgi:hypothetical protein